MGSSKVFFHPPHSATFVNLGSKCALILKTESQGEILELPEFFASYSTSLFSLLQSEDGIPHLPPRMAVKFKVRSS